MALLLAFFLVVPATPAWSEDEPEEPTIEDEEEERQRLWEEENEERIVRVTARGRNFHELLDAYFK